MNRGRRLRAPREDRGLLVAPTWSKLIALIAANRAAAESRGDDEIAGIPLARLCEEARDELVHEAHAYTKSYRDVTLPWFSPLAPRPSPLLLAGHQPELFHPGVWAKNFAIARLAKECGATAVNLVVDGDVLKSATLRVPTGTVDAPHVEAVPFDAPQPEIPYEERRIGDAAAFTSFGVRACAVIRPFIPSTLLENFWPLVLDEARRSEIIGGCFARARHRLEGMWGLETLELPQSRLCETVGFARFTAHLLADLQRFHEAHNGALADYRRVERIRSANHPVPALAADDRSLEAPLWIWTADDPRRRRAFVRRTNGELELTDRASIVVRLPTRDLAAAVEALVDLPRRGIRLRSRALVTTMYARLVLSDLFLHGIGGGKYDELTDEIVRRFFGFEPPRFGVLTATRYLPIARRSHHDDDESRALAQRQWELTHHPEKFVDGAARDSRDRRQAAALVAEKQRLIASAPQLQNTKPWCQAIRGVNTALQPLVAAQRRVLAEKQARVERNLQVETVLMNREYSSFLFPEKDLRDFLLAISP